MQFTLYFQLDRADLDTDFPKLDPTQHTILEKRRTELLF